MAVNDNGYVNNQPQGYGNAFSADTVTDIQAGLAAYMNKVFTKMSFGLLITFITSAVVLNTELLFALASAYKVILILQLVVVFAMSFGVNKLSAPALNVSFVVYSVLTGCTIGLVSAVFDITSVLSAFVATAALFGGLAVVGYVTKKDLSRLGSILLAGLIAIIVMSLVNLFIFKSSGFDMAIDIAAVLIFCGLTMYDVNKIKQIYFAAAVQGGSSAAESELLSKVSIMGALTLYLDFINIFLRLLSLFGKKR